MVCSIIFDETAFTMQQAIILLTYNMMENKVKCPAIFSTNNIPLIH